MIHKLHIATELTKFFLMSSFINMFWVMVTEMWVQCKVCYVFIIHSSYVSVIENEPIDMCKDNGLITTLQDTFNIQTQGESSGSW